MREKILNLDEQIIKRTIIRKNNRIIISEENANLTIFLNQYIPEKFDFIFHPFKCWIFKKFNCSLVKKIQPNDCRAILFANLERLSPEDIWKRIQNTIEIILISYWCFFERLRSKYAKISTM